MDLHLFSLILIMVVCGLTGGVVNYISLSDKENKKESIIKSLLYGLVASFLVPLFLNTISSDLVNESKNDQYKLLVFTGFCLIASFSAKAFIDSVSQKILKDVQKNQSELTKKVENIYEDMTPILIRQTEIIDDNYDFDKEAVSDKDEAEKLRINNNDSDENKVIKAIGNEKYTYRTEKGIARCLKLDNKIMLEIIKELITKGIIKSNIKDGENLYSLTEAGKKELNRINDFVKG